MINDDGSIHAHSPHIKWSKPFMCSILICKQLWMGKEPQPLHNGPAAAQDFGRLQTEGQKGRWQQANDGSVCPSTSDEVVQTPLIYAQHHSSNTA